MKIYTKKGDQGETDLLYKRVKKNDLKIEVNGTIDELIAFIGYSAAIINNQKIKEQLKEIIKDLSSMMHELASKKIINITEEKVVYLEELIDYYNNYLPPLKEFVYFTNDPKSAIINVCRTITRRLERVLVTLSEKEKFGDNILKYINRLSDLFFVKARYIAEIED